MYYGRKNNAKNQLYYTAKFGKDVELMRTTVDGNAERLTFSGNSGEHHHHPCISPDGNMLVFGSIADGERKLSVMDIQTQVISPVTGVYEGRVGRHPIWQAEKIGERIV